MAWLLVGVGGALGAMARFGLGGVVHRALPGPFPAGTFLINAIGCLAFGVLAGVGEARGALSSETRAFLLVGVLGGFTTFSSFGHETFVLIRDGRTGLALINAGGQVVLGVGAVWLGWAMARALA